jgi:hypothetical protein
MARLLTRPTPAVISPTHPESAKTAASPKDAPFRGQVRSFWKEAEVEVERGGRLEVRGWMLEAVGHVLASSLVPQPSNLKPHRPQP